MDTTELLDIIARGEDSRHQFKANITNPRSLASEMVAFSNSQGGLVLVGVDDDGNISGLGPEDMRRLNQLVANASTNLVRPPINLQTENISTPNGLVMSITVLEAISKPYMDNEGVIWVKSGSDKRRVTAREEMRRIFQSAGLLHGDEILTRNLTVADLDLDYFRGFFEKEFGESLDEQQTSLPKMLENMNLMKDGVLNVSGALLFAKNPSTWLPAFVVKAVSYPGTEIDSERYLNTRDITGKLERLFDESMHFALGSIFHVQGDRGINTVGEPEIARTVFEELIANALIHRDYFVSGPVRLFVFRDRIEIISPGHLPNNLTVENIKSGNSNIRNPILASYATKILPYRGLGSGIIRALKAHPAIDFIDDRDGNQFKAIIHRTNST